MDEARDVEIEGLLLAPAAVGDEECAVTHHRDKGEEVEPRDAPDVFTERSVQAVLGERRDRDRVVDPEKRPRALGENFDRLLEQGTILEELEAVQADDAEFLF